MVILVLGVCGVALAITAVANSVTDKRLDEAYERDTPDAIYAVEMATTLGCFAAICIVMAGAVIAVVVGAIMVDMGLL